MSPDRSPSTRLLLAALWAFCPWAFSPHSHGQPAVDLDGARDLHRAGAWEEAVAAYREVARTDTDLASAAIAHNNACVLLVELGRPQEAIAECETALRIRRDLDDPRRLGRTLNNYGRALQQNGDFDEADAAYREALALNRDLDDVEAQLINLSNLGLLATSAGRYGEALNFFSESEASARRHLDQPFAPRQLTVTRINRSVVLEKLGALREALEIYDDILARSEEIDDRRLAVVEVNRGVMLRQLGDPAAALDSFERAAARLAESGDRSSLANARLNAALALHLNLGRPEEAASRYAEALDLARASGDRGEEIQALFYSGRFALDQERLEDAERFFSECADISAAVGSAEGSWSALEGLGLVAERRGDPAAAAAHFRDAIRLIEEVRGGLDRRELRQGYFGDQRAVYAATVRVLLELGESREALAIVQRAKARELVEELGASDRSVAIANRDDLDRLAESGPVLELFMGRERLFAWVVAEGEIQGFDLGPKAPLADAAEAVVRRITAGEPPASTDLDRLAEAILLRTGIMERSDDSLHIAPDGAFSKFPFEILPFGASTLVEERIVAYLPSLSARAWLHRRRDLSQERDEDLVFAGVAAGTPPQIEDDHPASFWLSRFHLAPLKEAEAEIRDAAETLAGPNRLAAGEEATEATFAELAESSARVLHIAAHAVVDDGFGGGAAILLAADQADDGLVLPDEIVALNLRNRLTVLAACSSSLAMGEGASALGSLSGAFLAAGSPAVVAALWDVDDAATKIFMEQFYFELRRGHVPQRALQLVKLRLKNDARWNRLEWWAPWVIIGEGSPIVERRSRLQRIAPVFFAALLIALFLRRREFRSRSR